MVEFGIVLTGAQWPGDSERDVYENLVADAEFADSLDFSTIWLLEHHFTKYGIVPSPLLLCSHLLARTERIALGTAISVVTLDHPVRLAEQVAMLDRLAPDRFRFGIGRGIATKDFPVFGADPSASDAILREWTSIMRRSWNDETVESSSELCSFPPVPVYPTPSSGKELPLFVAAESASTTEWAATEGISLMLPFWVSVEAMSSQISFYNEIAESVGRNPADANHMIAVFGHVGEDRESAKSEVFERIEWWLRVGDRAALQLEELRKLPNYSHYMRRWEERVYEPTSARHPDVRAANIRRVLDQNPIGSVQDCRDILQNYIDATGVTNFAIGFEGVPPEQARQDMKIFNNDILPTLN